MKAGVDAGTLFEAVSRSTGNTRSMQWRYPPALLKGNFTPTFTVDLVRKDLGLAIELAENYGVPLQLGPLAYKEYDEMSQGGRGQLDTSSVALLQEERAGVEIRADVEPH